MTPEPRAPRRPWLLPVIVLAVLAAGIAVWLATRPGFDLSTPEKCLETFQRCLDQRRWSRSEECLTARCREHYRQAIVDRRLFDFYSPHGYTCSGYRLIPDWKVRSVETEGDRARARVATKLPFPFKDEVGFRLQLIRDGDGLWRIDGPLLNFDRHYEELIPEEAKGWAAVAERK